MKKGKDSSLPPYQLILDQGLAVWIAQVNAERRMPLFQALDAILNDLNGQDKAFAEALKEILDVRKKIGTPEHILGNNLTKHGEIAEIAEVGITNAREIVKGGVGNAVWDNANRLAAEDYTIGGVAVQSKFVNGINDALADVIDHARKYPEFGKSDGAYYHIPRDHFEKIKAVLTGDNNGLSQRTADAIRAKVQQIEALRDRSFDDLVRPASHDYHDVMRGKIQQTLERHESDLSLDNQAMKSQIQEKHRESIEDGQIQSAPSFGELGKVAATGAAFGAGLQLTVSIFQKWRVENRLPTQWTAKDWEEIGATATSGAMYGGVSAGALYGLTNFSSLSAPFAGAVVSSGMAIASLARQYHAGVISYDEFTGLSIVTTTEAGIVAAGALLGQTIIPIPIVGAFIGGTAARLASSHGRRVLETGDDRFAQSLRDQYKEAIACLDAKHLAKLAVIEEKFHRLGDLTSAAFDTNLNAELLLINSTILALEYGVPQEKILFTVSDLDAYITGAPN